MPAIGTSLSLIAIGAILRYAVTAAGSWASLATVGFGRRVTNDVRLDR